MESEFRSCSNDIWHIDTELVGEPDAYMDFLERLSELSSGSLQIDGISLMPTEASTLLLTFCANRSQHQVQLQLSDDWLDLRLYSYVNELCRSNGSGYAFFQADLGGQDLLVSYGKNYDREALSTICKLDFV